MSFGQARSQDLLANRAMPILSSHADEEANNCVKKIIFRPSGQPGQFCGQPGHCPSLPMPGYGPGFGYGSVLPLCDNTIHLCLM
jgi:hypothetical protein